MFVVTRPLMGVLIACCEAVWFSPTLYFNDTCKS